MSADSADLDPPQPPPDAAEAAYPSLQELAQLLPQYEMHDVIGIGGMGAVYKARQVALDRWVAIKVLPAAASQNTEDTQRFIKEARSMARLVHPHIVAVFDFGQTYARHLYLVMEYVEGMDLHQRTRAGEITPQRARDVISQLCDALQFAHDHGVAHRDIKPANILITLDWKVKVADFGLARELSATPNADEPEFGTPDYTAPERLIIGAVVDHRADIYALGVVIHEMLTGQTPAAAGKNACQGLPDGFAGVISKCLMAEPERRYQKALEVKAALLTATTERPTASQVSRPAASVPPVHVPQAPVALDHPISYEPSFATRLRRMLGPLGWGLASLMLLGGFGWLMLKDDVRIEVAEPSPPPAIASGETALPKADVTPPPMPPAAPSLPVPMTPPPKVEVPVVTTVPVAPPPFAKPYAPPEGEAGGIGRLDGHTGPAYSLTLLSDQRRLLSASLDGTVRMWDLETQKELMKMSPQIDQIQRLAISADESTALIYSTRSDKLAVIDLLSGRIKNQVQFPHDRLNHAALSTDGKLVIAGGGHDELTNNLFVWKPEAGALLEPVPGFRGRMNSLLSRPNAEGFLLTGSEAVDAQGKNVRPYVAMYSAASGQLNRLNLGALGYLSKCFPNATDSAAFTLGTSPKVVSLPDLRLLRSWPTPPREGPFPLAGALAGTNRWLLSSWTDQTLRIYEVDSGDEVWRMSLNEPVIDIALSRDERWAVLSTRFRDPKKQSDATYDLLVWRLPKWTELVGPRAAVGSGSLTQQMADLARLDPELAKLRENLKNTFVPPSEQELAEQRRKLDEMYLNALRREMAALPAAGQNGVRAEAELIARGGPLPSKDLDASAPPVLHKLRGIYRSQLSALHDKHALAFETMAKSVSSYLLPLRQKREAAGDKAGAARVTAVLEEWQIPAHLQTGTESSATSPPTPAGMGTPTQRPSRQGSVVAMQRVAQNTSPMNPPPEVSRVPRSLGPVVALTGGMDHVFALQADGQVQAWGQWGGQPAAVPSAAVNVVQLDSSDASALALRSDGKIIAWGPNNASSPGSWQMREGRIPLSVHAGAESSGFVLCTDGSLQDVGSGEPMPPSDLGPVARLSFIPATRGWCAIQRDGVPVYWGTQMTPITPLPEDLRGLISLDMAAGYGVALQRDGTLVGWGQLAQKQRFRSERLSGAVEILHDAAGRVFAVHRNDHSWELPLNPNIPEYIAEDRVSVLEGRLRGCIDAVFTREYVIALKP